MPLSTLFQSYHGDNLKKKIINVLGFFCTIPKLLDVLPKDTHRKILVPPGKQFPGTSTHQGNISYPESRHLNYHVLHERAMFASHCVNISSRVVYTSRTVVYSHYSHLDFHVLRQQGSVF